MFLNKKKVLNNIIDKFSSLLTDKDVFSCKELNNNREYLLAYNTIITQLYEYDVELTNEEYVLFEKAAKKLKIDFKEYKMLKELIRDKNYIPKTVKENIAEIINIVRKSKDDDSPVRG